jgi:hypothetical protein
MTICQCRDTELFFHRLRGQVRIFGGNNGMKPQRLLSRILRIGANVPETDLILHTQFFILPSF